MRKRLQPWQQEKQRTAKALRELPRCEYTDGCKGKAMGMLARRGPFRLLLACPKCAAEARKVRNQTRAEERNVRPRYYDRQGTPLASVQQWADLFEQLEYKRVERTVLEDGTEISTVWLGLDHQFGNGPPLIFETMAFAKTASGREETDHERYSTEAEARAGHAAMVAKYSPAPRPPREL